MLKLRELNYSQFVFVFFYLQCTVFNPRCLIISEYKCLYVNFTDVDCLSFLSDSSTKVPLQYIWTSALFKYYTYEDYHQQNY